VQRSIYLTNHQQCHFSIGGKNPYLIRGNVSDVHRNPHQSPRDDPFGSYTLKIKLCNARRFMKCSIHFPFFGIMGCSD